ncbi:MAG: T9SS type A sorting domain-containing protein, partial [Candidatus Zixiibacteriota bacterium]
LYALDQYNGVLRYDLSAPGFGQFLDYLFVPRVTTSFSHHAGMFALTLGRDTLLLGEFGHVGSGVIDTVVGSRAPQRSFLLDSVLVLVSFRFAEVISLADHDDRTLVELTGQGFRGEIVTVGIREKLLLPDSDGGVTLFDIHDFDSGIQALHRSGSIEDLLLADDLLLTSGGANPIDVFAPESEGFPEPEYTMFGSMHGASALDRNGDTLFAYYADLNRVVVVLKATDPDSFFLERSFSVDTSGVQRIQFVPRPLGTLWPFLIIGGFDINMYTIDDSSRIEHAATWNFVGRIESALMHDSLLLVSTSKSQLFVMEVHSDFTTELRSAINLPGRAQAMTWANDRLMLFVHDELFVINLDNPSAPSIEDAQTLPIGVLDIDIDGNRMYTIGPDGAGIFSLDSAMPELLAWGGRPGHIIAANSRMLATSDGGSVHVYQFQTLQSNSSPPQLPIMFSLDQNYPNPFNASTVIRFTLYRSAKVRISVVNALGQTVSVLVDRFLQPGDHQARWDGRNAAGIDVASGIYFYRLSAGDETAARKMMLIK